MQDLDGSAGKENLPRWLPTLAMDREVLGSIIAPNKLFQREIFDWDCVVPLSSNQAALEQEFAVS